MQLVNAGTSDCYIQQPDVPIALYSLLNVAPDDGLMIVRKNVQPFNEKMKTIQKNLCISLVYIHNATHRSS